MSSNVSKRALRTTAVAASALLLLASGAALAQTTAVTLTASPTATTLPDGQTVPMWGLLCGNVSGATLAYKPGTDSTNPNATPCTTMTGGAQNGTWQPPLITVPAGNSLQITLVNNLSFATSAANPPATAPNNIPTSLVIVGQLGGGLGTDHATMPSPAHGPQGTTWPGTLGGNNAAAGDTVFNPPAQADRVRSMATEVLVGDTTTDPNTSTTTPGKILTWTNLRPGTYLIESGTQPSIQGPMGLYGVLVVTEADTASTATPASAHQAYGTYFDTAVPVLLSEIDPIQNREVAQVVQNAGFLDTAVWNGQVGGCGDVTQPATAHTCYPAAVNYSPLYYLVNGASFDRTNLAGSTLSVPTAGTQKNVLLRFVNAGLRLHVPSVVGANMTLLAEDGNKLPGTGARVQASVALPAGKTYDVAIQPTQSTTGTYDNATLPLYDRDLSLSTSNQRDGGMQAYLKIGTGASGGTGTSAVAASLTAADRTYFCESGSPVAPTLAITDPSLGLLTGTTGANGVVLGSYSGDVSAATLTLNSDGTFRYTPTPGTTCGGSFTFKVNGTLEKTASIVQCDNNVQGAGCALAGGPVAKDILFVSSVASRFVSPPPGVLAGVTNPGGLALTASGAGINADGSFAVAGPGSGSCTNAPTAPPAGASCVVLPYTVTNLQGKTSAANAYVAFLPASNLQVRVYDAPSLKPGKTPAQITDYRWIIEEDRTFWIDPKCQINVSPRPLDSNGKPCPPLPVESLGYNFHTANMPVIAQGCVGTVSCEAGQTVGGVSAVCDIGNGVCRTDTATTLQQASLNPGDVHLDPAKRYFISILPGDGVNPTIGGAGGPAGGSAGTVSQSGTTVTLNNPNGMFGVVTGDRISISGSTVTSANGTCQVTGTFVNGTTPTNPGQPFDTVICTASASGSGTDNSGNAMFAGTRPFDVLKDCGPYSAPTGPWEPGGTSAMCGHAMGGAQVSQLQVASNGVLPVSIALQETPLPTAQIAAFIFEDDSPLNGENDAGGGVDIIAPNEPGLGGFEVKLFDQAGGLGDATGQITYDMFNQPVSNALAGKVDPMTGLDACPITARKDGLVGMIPTCPKYESDGVTPSPLAGQVVIANLYPGLYEIQAYPAADRIANGEEWLQTNTLDGGKPHEAFIKPNEPGYFQEFGPGGFHVAIGFANPAIINARKSGYCSSKLNNSQPCTNTLVVNVTNTHMSRTPDQRTFSSESYDHYSFTQCYVSIGPADGDDFAFEKCVQGQDPATGKTVATATFKNMPPGVFKITVFDQWNDIMLDGLVGTATINAGTTVQNFPVTQWRTNLYTRTFIDNGCGTAANAGDGVSQECEPGLALVNTNIRYRDGSIGFFNNTDMNGYAGFNEVFPFMNWLVVETSSTRFKPTGTHTVYDAGGPVDCSGQATAAGLPCSTIAANIASTDVRVPLPADLRIPGAKYCDQADCPAGDPGTGKSTGTVFPPEPWGTTMGWQGLLGQNSFMEFGVKPFKAASGTTPAENGGISGQVVYASTRPFDDPALLLQLQWEPGVPRVKVNLYRKTLDASSGNERLELVDTTTTASWDDWAQGFRTDAGGNPMQSAAGAGYIPNISCPGQDGNSPFFQTLKDSKQWLDTPGAKKALAYHSQFKCFDGWSMLNQIQPAPYDGMYRFPSVTAVDPTTGKPVNAATGAFLTNCKPGVCVVNPDDGTAMLPAGKYVVEVIVPPGYELVKEEDKNILLGDVYVAPVTQQFAGFGNIFIMPDQAAVQSAYNPNNPGGLNTTTDLGAQPRHEGDTGSIESFWPCVGAERVVPDLNSLYPGAGQAAPFAGAKRRLCDRKEVTLADESSVLAKFFVFSSTHIAGHFTGTITNDFASEFDPFSPQFGEKFGPPNLPVGMRDFTGNEVARVYSDQWGIYNGLFFSSYGVNPPNPTGYVPQMAIACMNDPGDDTARDAAYNPAYSNFCYETPFMPGFTAYMDTPVIPTQSFADGYNLPDAEYPDLTPAIGGVTSGDFAGPWVSAAGHTLTISCLGSGNTADPCSKVVQNPNFSGPNASTSPFNQKTIVRHYGFGSTPGSVTIAGTAAAVQSWSNTQIVVTVPTISANLSASGVGSTCYSGSSATPPAGQTPRQRGVSDTNYRCGELVITRGDNGKKSIDGITVTVAGSAPWLVTPQGVQAPGGKSVNDYGKALGRLEASPIQTAIDSAAPGDLIIVGPGTYRENVIMWKPVRLQGVGAGSVTINADAHPAGKMDQWRRQVTCAFGLTVDGTPNLNNTGYDPSSAYSCPAAMHQRVDRIPFEAIVGWDASGNGNLAQVLQEPTLMGSYEGAGITVLGRGIRIPANSTDFWGLNATGGAGAFTDGSVYLTSGTSPLGGNDCAASTSETDGRDYGTSNYLCNPSRIDGLSIINSSQGGGGVFIHGWSHYLDVANTRISANHGTLTGGINLGNGETPDAFVNDGLSCGVNPPVMACPPIPPGTATNAAIPFQFNTRVHIHNNMVYNNASIGDALFSGTPSGGGAVTISAGADNYKIDHNWIAGNLSTGDGGGVQHLGLSFNGNISNNYILYNQSTNPTLPTNGGGLTILGANLDRTLNGQECGSVTDQDCPPGLGQGTGPGLVIDANLILGNSSESGSGGGLRLQQVNGTELLAFPLLNAQWYDVTVTNNIIANNVAGWDGGGVSIQDALKVTFINNTVSSNDTTASAGVLFKTLGAITAASPPPGCSPQTDPTLPQDPSCTGADAPHGPQPSGLVVMAHTPNLHDAIAGLTPNVLGLTVLCPIGYGYGGILGANGDCTALSKPRLVNDLFWQNRAFRIDIVGPGSGNQSQQNLVTLKPLLVQTATGQCPSGASYWDIGLRTDDVASGAISTTSNKLALSNSILTGDPQGALTTTATTIPASSPVVAQFCNGARVPPEGCSGASADQLPMCKGFNAPPGQSETTGLAQLFVFDGIQPTATVDEGHNWLNLSYGPLTLTRPNVSTPTNGEQMVTGGSAGTRLGAYSIPVGSPAVGAGTTTGLPSTTSTDIFGNARSGRNDAGAVQLTQGASAAVSPEVLAFGPVAIGQTSQQTLTLAAGTTAMSGISVAVSGGGFSRPAGAAGGTCGTSLGAAATCTINVSFAPTASATYTGTVTITSNVTVLGSPVSLTGTGAAIDVNVTPASLNFTTFVNTASAVQLVTLANTSSPAKPVTGIVATVVAPSTTNPEFFRSTTTPGSCPTSAPFTLNAGASCTIGVQFNSSAAGGFVGAVSVTAATGFNVGAPVVLNGTAGKPVVTPASLAFGKIPTGKTSAPQTLTLSNPTGMPTFTISAIAATAPFSRPAGAAGGTCASSLAAGSTCTINVVYTAPSTAGPQQSGTLTITGNSPVANSPVALTGVPVAPPAKPALSTLDNFNRANAGNLGGNWQQATIAGVAAIGVNNNQANDALLAGNAYWNQPLAGIGAGQAAATTLVNVSAGNAPALVLMAGGSFTLGNYSNAIRVRYNGAGAVVVETTTNGTAFATQATLAGAFLAGNRLTAQVDANGNVYVWRTAGATDNYLGSVSLGGSWASGGQVGISLGTGGRVDDFAGGLTNTP